MILLIIHWSFSGIAENASPDMKKITIILAMLSFVLGAIGYRLIANRMQTSTHFIRVTTTLFPLYDFVKQVGGDRVDVKFLLPPGTEAHAFEPTPNDIVRIQESNLFVYTSQVMEPWAQDLMKGLSEKRVRILEAGKEISMIQDSDEGGMDPHVWLDFENAGKMVDAIADELSAVDPAFASAYHANASAYRNELSKLDGAYRSTLETCRDKTIIYGGHYAFGYLAKRYRLNYVAAQGIAPDAEPTANDLIALVDQIRRDHVTTVFYEELSSPKIAETIANETGAQMSLLNAAHNISKEDASNGTTFVSIMQGNLERLAQGLGCHLSL